MAVDDRQPPEVGHGPDPAAGGEGGPAARLRAFLGPRMAVAHPRDEPIPVAWTAAGRRLHDAGSAAVMAAAVGAAGPTGRDDVGFRQRLVEQYRRRRPDHGPGTFAARAAGGLRPQAPRPAPTVNWIPIGPTVARQGQAAGRPAVSGRVAGIAVAPGGQRVYVAAANGGVWRSDDAGRTWQSTMEDFDLQPTTAASDSLACGAIALDPADPDRVYVGTGEGAGAAYFGVGPIRSDDGGANWRTEPTAPGSPELGGQSFFQLAVDPTDPDRVVAAASVGLYRREPDGRGGFHWTLVRPGTFTSVVAAHAGRSTTFYAARRDGETLRSSDCHAWNPVGSDFPTDPVGRIGLACRPTDPSIVYALIARRDNDHLLGLWRLDIDLASGAGKWRQVHGVPADLFGPDPSTPGQGGYDLALAVDPDDADSVYLGGSTRLAGDPPEWSSCIYRGRVGATGTDPDRTYHLHATYIGADVHADVHALVFTPGCPGQLWVGCDGGAFRSDDVRGAARFAARNLGLATLTLNKVALHPSTDAILYSGSQDNGTLRFAGDDVWLHCAAGDGGTAVVHPREPDRVIRTYSFGILERCADGGRGYDSWEDASLPAAHQYQAEFYAPLVGAPFDPARPETADLIAFGGVRVWISREFGANWQAIPGGEALPGVAGAAALASCLAFATPERLYAGALLRRLADPSDVVGGRVFRFDLDPRVGTWRRFRLDADPLPNVPVTDIAVDPEDPTGLSIYVTLGGHEDFRHVWHHDGTAWTARSGPADGDLSSLLNAQHNAILVDPDHHGHLYAAADIGVWRSTDSGRTWSPFAAGLPEAAVLDLVLYRPRRLLIAATHGRGAFEFPLDQAAARPVELYLRGGPLDRGRRAPGAAPPNGSRFSPDIKIDVPPYQLDGPLDCLLYADALEDRGDRIVATGPGVPPTVARVHVQVHNRGRGPARGVRAMLLAARVGPDGSLPALPDGYAIDLRAGNAIHSGDWTTVGLQVLDGLRVDLPRVVSFDLPSDRLVPGDWCLLALLHGPDDPFEALPRAPDALATSEPKAALRQLRAASTLVLELQGVSPAPGGRRIVRIRLSDHGRPVAPDGGLQVSLAEDPTLESPVFQPMRFHRGWKSYCLALTPPQPGTPSGPPTRSIAVEARDARWTIARGSFVIPFD